VKFLHVTGGLKETIHFFCPSTDDLKISVISDFGVDEQVVFI
jgi:hypothetical protein